MSRPSGYLVSLDGAWKRIRRGSAAFLGDHGFQVPRRKSKIGSRNGSKFHRDFETLKEQEEDTMTSVSVLQKQKQREEEEQQSLYERLACKLFKGKMSDKRYSDIIRTAHIVQIETRKAGSEPQSFVASKAVTEEEYPDKHKREMQRMVMIIEQLVHYFAPSDAFKEEALDLEVEEKKEKHEISFDEAAMFEQGVELQKPIPMNMKRNRWSEIIEFIYAFSEQYSEGLIPKRHFNLAKLFSALQEEFKESELSLCLLKVRSVLRFLHISVVIHAIEELRTKLDLGLDYLTKDLKDGWMIKLRLNDRFLEISHVRQECVLRQKGENNYWEIGYNVTLSFDATMKNFSAVRLSLTDLKLSDEIDKELAVDLKKKFFDGNFIIC